MSDNPQGQEPTSSSSPTNETAGDTTTKSRKTKVTTAETAAAEHAIEHAQAVEQASEQLVNSEPGEHDDYQSSAPEPTPQRESSADNQTRNKTGDDSQPEPEPEQAAVPTKKKTSKRTSKKTVKKAAKRTSKKVAVAKAAQAAEQDDELPDEPADEAADDSALAEISDQTDDDDEPEIEEPPRKLESCRMVINYVPGEECRVALLENGRLEEFHSERMDAISRVNNIYVGRVANVESGIQAAFVDFGIGESGFLHVSDLHPRYFPGAEKDDSERVGRKTPRRERPPIQQALRKGQEIVVQVLKEGVGTKGPTLTSYLSIPGRYLVMMPQMDEVGVSRKVEDEQTRKEMRKILDTLDLPENFGFILRTAGLGKTKAELKRDLSYLQRLWKDLEKRLKSGRAPRLLYSESDLLLRALRDFLTPEVEEIVIDNEHALRRANQFLKIAAPRSSVRLHSYTGAEPAFHAFGIEEQIDLMHAREVPLPSGGRLVIDQTEAVVAIDVNSGRMRSARDSETNALQTNLEAVDEICRQLRLRDLGGIVINDLIDMRPAKNRKLIEQRFKDRLKRDRARTTVATISQFGILEMTRQRMRGSQHSQTFTDCPTCHGRGAVKRPSSVSSESMRKVATLLSYPKVAKVELVIGPRVAGELLSKKRRTLNRLERLSGKQVEVRVMEMTEPDRVVLYAYEAGGADIDIERLPAPKNPERFLQAWIDPDPTADWADLESGVEETDELIEETDPLAVDLAPDIEEEEKKPAKGKASGSGSGSRSGSGDDTTTGTGSKKKRRRRRRGKRSDEADNEIAQSDGETSSSDDAKPQPDDDSAEDDSAGPEGESSSGDESETGERRKKKRRRRRRGKRKSDGEAGSESAGDGGEQESADHSAHQSDGDDSTDASDTGDTEGADHEDSEASEEGDRPRKKKRRRRRRKGGGGSEGGDQGSDDARKNTPSEATPAANSLPGKPAAHTEIKPSSTTSGTTAASAATTGAKPRPRTLYGTTRRKLSTAEAAKIAKRKD